MTWNRKTAGNRHAIDGESAVMFREAKDDVDGHPPSLMVIRAHEDAVKEVIKRAPMHCHLTFATSGHFDHDHTGSALLKIEIADEVPEVAPRWASPRAALPRR
jgi:hypothetical protein